jgi:hypothetical protein
VSEEKIPVIQDETVRNSLLNYKFFDAEYAKEFKRKILKENFLEHWIEDIARGGRNRVQLVTDDGITIAITPPIISTENSMLKNSIYNVDKVGELTLYKEKRPDLVGGVVKELTTNMVKGLDAVNEKTIHNDWELFFEHYEKRKKELFSNEKDKKKIPSKTGYNEEDIDW